MPDAAKALLLGATVLPAVYFRWERGYMQGGETPAEFRSRLMRALGRIVESHSPGDEIAVFCHGYVITYLAERVCESGPFFRISRYVKNGSITTTEVRPGGGLVLKEFAATRHLG
jgi:broad specificity phosphatase PhoE